MRAGPIVSTGPPAGRSILSGWIEGRTFLSRTSDWLERHYYLAGRSELEEKCHFGIHFDRVLCMIGVHIIEHSTRILRAHAGTAVPGPAGQKMFDYARAQLYVNCSQNYRAGPQADTRWLAGRARNLQLCMHRI